ncbi:MAG TPA: Gfo/Idh/MocA family oxidoreductase [Pirellulales bacterium]|nr:Gfo/Idh/MocA family oxidoreductase [Pirellulales bacterium]
MPRACDRRQFLGQSAALATAMTMVHTAGSALADEPRDTLGVALVGTNNRGSQLAPAFASQPGVEIRYVCDPEDGALQKGLKAVATKQQKTPQTVRDFRRALDDKAVDAVVIATPDHWHAPAAILACAAGKHVYVEKPASHNGREGELLVAAARKHKRVVQLGTQRRSSDDIVKAIGRLHAGELGRVLLSRAWTSGLRQPIGHGKQVPVPSTLDYDLWQGPAVEQPYVDNLVHYNWHWFWNYGTGEVGNNSIHALDLCRWGLKVDYPHRVTSGGGRYHFDDDQQTPDTLISTFDFDGASITNEMRTWNRQPIEGSEFGAAFYGEKGTLVIGKAITLYDPKGKQLEQSPMRFSNNAHVANFFQAIREGSPLNAEIAEGVKSTALCHLANIAYRTGRTINFDPAAARITGDDEAAALWTREYRRGWEPKV